MDWLKSLLGPARTPEQGIFWGIAEIRPGYCLLYNRSGLRVHPYPKTYHPAYLTAVGDRLRQILDDPSSPLLPLINLPAVRAMIKNKGDAFNRPWFGQLMTGPQLFAYLIQLDALLREYRVMIL